MTPCFLPLVLVNSVQALIGDGFSLAGPVSFDGAHPGIDMPSAFAASEPPRACMEDEAHESITHRPCNLFDDSLLLDITDHLPLHLATCSATSVTSDSQVPAPELSAKS